MEPVNPLGADARKLLEAYRRQVPAAAKFQRDWARVTAALDPDDEVDSVDEPETAAPSDRGSVQRIAIASGLAVAIAAAVLLLLRGVVGVATALGSSAHAPMEAIDRADARDEEQVAQAQREAKRSRATSEVTRPSDDGEAAIDTAPSVPVPPANAEGSGRSLSAVPERAPEPAPADHDAALLAEETRLLRAAREALAAGDPEAALRSLSDHEERFPRGALLEERMLYRAIALCRGGAPDPAEAAAFLRRFPSSPHAPRLRSECGQVDGIERPSGTKQATENP